MNLVEITRVRRLPYAGTVIVNKGQKVSSGDVVAEMNFYPGMVNKLQVSRYLAIKPEKLPEVVKVRQGDMVEQGQLLAFDTLWHRPQVMLAPQSGIIGMISRTLGIVYLRKLTEFNPNPIEVHDIAEELDLTPIHAKRAIIVRENQRVAPGQIIAQRNWKGNRLKMSYVATELFGVVKEVKNNVVTIESRQMSQKLNAYLTGEVVKVEPNWSATIKAQAYKLQGVYGIAGERSGRLRIIDGANLTEQDIKLTDQDSVLMVRGHISKDALQKASDIGVSAIIGASCKLAVLRKYAGADFIPGITGGEPVNTGVVLLNGFTGQEISESMWRNFKRFAGCQVAVNGTTHIRAGAIRPEILVFPRTVSMNTHNDYSENV